MIEAFDPRDFRRALGSFATGVTIITTRGADGDIGVTANSFNSVSIDPPLVLWSLAKNSRSLAAFADASHFAVHILASNQEELSNQFANSGIDKFNQVGVTRGANDIPLLEGCSARFQCRSAYRYEGGDHIIFVGEVVAYEHRPAPPLLFHGGRYVQDGGGVDPTLSAETDLGHLLQRAYFQVLTPVRAERERLQVGLHDHYVLGVLMSGPHTVNQIDAVISYTGLRITPLMSSEMASRDLINIGGDDNNPILRISERGRQAIVSLAAATKAIEAEAMLTLKPTELLRLKQLLVRLSTLFGAAPGTPVFEHMDVLERQLRAIGS